MALDPYASCPCGSGKKLKFCCADLKGEIETIARMIEGEQRVACLTHIESLLKKHPGRASLRCLQAMLQTDLGQFDAAQQSLDALFASEPDNPVGLAELAILQAEMGEAEGAVASVQSAFDHSGSHMPDRILTAIGMTAAALLDEGKVPAARAHFVLQARFNQDRDPRALSILVQLNQSPQIPLLLKDDPLLSACPGDPPWKTTFDNALALAEEGRWWAAEQQFDELAAQAGDVPEILRNLAILRLWLADEEDGVATLRQYAALDVPLDDAVDAEAYAQRVEPPSDAGRVELLRLTFTAHDVAAIAAALTADSRAYGHPVEESMWASHEGPPPRSVFRIANQSVPEDGDGLTLETLPVVIADVALFGRETDREARLELVTLRNEFFDASQAVLHDLCDGALDLAPQNEERMGALSGLQAKTGLGIKLPANLAEAQIKALMSERLRHLYLNVWPELPAGGLSGQTPASAAADPAMRTKLLAAILVLELDADAGDAVDFQELRRKLGLPEAAPIDPTAEPDELIPLVRLARVDVEKLSDDHLVYQFRRSAQVGYANALRKLAPEVIRRDSLDAMMNRGEAFAVLAELADSPQAAIDYLAQGRALDEQQGKSSAPWDLRELTMHLRNGDEENSQRLFLHLRNNHLQEPGVADALTGLLEAVRSANAGRDAPRDGAEESSPLVVPSGQSPEAGKVWTPDQARGGEPSKLWVPGSD